MPVPSKSFRKALIRLSMRFSAVSDRHFFKIRNAGAMKCMKDIEKKFRAYFEYLTGLPISSICL